MEIDNKTIQVIEDAINDIRISHQRIRYKDVITPMALKYINGKIDAYNEILDIIKFIKEGDNGNQN